VYLEGATSVGELRTIGRAFRGVPLALSILEGGGKTPVLPPQDFFAMGFTMLLYPTSILFRVTKTMERAAYDLRMGRPMPTDESVDMKTFEQIVDLPYWSEIEKKFTS
jgi:2-methylisocitrate lyase-like PEP mutase family enzyme